MKSRYCVDRTLMAPLMIFAFSAFILVMIAHFTFGNGEGAPWRPLAETGSGRAP